MVENAAEHIRRSYYFKRRVDTHKVLLEVQNFATIISRAISGTTMRSESGTMLAFNVPKSNDFLASSSSMEFWFVVSRSYTASSTKQPLFLGHCSHSCVQGFGSIIL